MLTMVLTKIAHRSSKERARADVVPRRTALGGRCDYYHRRPSQMRKLRLPDLSI